METGPAAAQFLFFCEYLFQIFGIGSLQCIESGRAYQLATSSENFMKCVGYVAPLKLEMDHSLEKVYIVTDSLEFYTF